MQTKFKKAIRQESPESVDVTNSLICVSQPSAYFKELLIQALEEKKQKLTPEAEVYLVQLLSQFMNTDRLFARNQNGQYQEEPLVFLFKEALEQPEVESQRALFQQVGDVSLYQAGFFQDRLLSRKVDVDYYVQLGENAYFQVATRLPSTDKHKPLKTIFEELSDQFSSLVEVLAMIGDYTLPQNERNLLRVYELWKETGSERALKWLRKSGFTI
jgi:hypothetical protein